MCNLFICTAPYNLMCACTVTCLLFLDRHSGCFHSSAITNMRAMNVSAHVFWYTLASFSSSWCVEMLSTFILYLISSHFLNHCLVILVIYLYTFFFNRIISSVNNGNFYFSSSLTLMSFSVSSSTD